MEGVVTPPATSAELSWYRGRRVPVVSSYADGPIGQLIAVAGSTGFVELAIRERSAARRFRSRRGDRVTLQRSG